MNSVVRLTTFLFLMSASGLVAAQSTETLKKDLTYLASDELEGRDTGSPGEALAAKYIVSRFEELGLEPKGEDTWFQTFTFKPHPPVQMHGSGDSASMGMAIVKEITGKNVIGYIDNKAATTVVIGAHYDHLGWGNENSLHTGEKAIHNGADDNASGVSALLMIAENLIENHTANNYLLMAFSGEEKGLFGSNYFCDNPTIDLGTVNYMLNMDMVGRLNDEKKLAVYGTGTSPSWDKILKKIKVDDISITKTESGVGPSDHTSFYLEDLPVLHFFTGQHEDYHKPSDDSDKINYDGIESVVKYIEEVIERCEKVGRLEFTKTKDEDKDSSPSFNVTLGIMPDYMYEGEGMRIDGVTEGRTAHKAGIQKGDVVKKMGDLDVKDMYSYMEGLGMFKSGDKTIVVIERDGELMDIEVIWD